MIRFEHKVEGLVGRSQHIVPEALPHGVLMDRLDLSSIPSRPSRVYVEIPAGHFAVHRESALGAFSKIYSLDSLYETDTMAVQETPVYLIPEGSGNQRFRCGDGFDIQVIKPEYNTPIPASVAVHVVYEVRIDELRPGIFVQSFMNKVPLSVENLRETLQASVRTILSDHLASVLGNRSLTVEQVNEIFVGESGREIRRKIRQEIEEVVQQHGLLLNSVTVENRGIFDRMGTNLWSMHLEVDQDIASKDILLRGMRNDQAFIEESNEIKRAIEESDRELEDYRNDN